MVILNCESSPLCSEQSVIIILTGLNKRKWPCLAGISSVRLKVWYRCKSLKKPDAHFPLFLWRRSFQTNKHLLARWPVFPFKRHSSDGRVRLALLQGPRGRHLQAQLIRQFYGVRSLFVTFSFVVVPLFQIDGEGKMCQRTAEIEKNFQKNKQMTKSHFRTALFTYTFTYIC